MVPEQAKTVSIVAEPKTIVAKSEVPVADTSKKSLVKDNMDVAVPKQVLGTEIVDTSPDESAKDSAVSGVVESNVADPIAADSDKQTKTVPVARGRPKRKAAEAGVSEDAVESVPKRATRATRTKK